MRNHSLQYNPTQTTASEPWIASAELQPLISYAPEPLPPLRYEDLLLSRRLTAKWLLVTEDCLSTWDRKGLGPRPIRVGQHKMAYQIGSVLKWLASQAGAPGKQRQRMEKAERKSA